MKNKKRIREVLENQIKKIKLSEKELSDIEKNADEFCNKLKKQIKSLKIKAEVFIGGSLAKKTMLKKQKHDVDVFIRFDKKYKEKEIPYLLDKILNKIKGKIKIHGSRDYFQVKSGKVAYEVVPVVKISGPKQARNITDLSYFHVRYIKTKINKKHRLADEILLAKSFAFAHDCYGAESYIRGFSGYALELLVSYYGSFLSFLRQMIKSKKQIILDPKKYYKTRQMILFDLNEAKLCSPIVFVDPTFKERNALAALSHETFQKFQKAAGQFLKKPCEKYFEKKKIDEKKFNLILTAKTNKQEGDIAGSKLLKFYKFIYRELSKNFDVQKSDFSYNEKKSAKFYFKIKKKKIIIVDGPQIANTENARNFKKKHKKVFVKKKRIFAKEKSLSINKFLKKFIAENKKRFSEMSVKLN